MRDALAATSRRLIKLGAASMLAAAVLTGPVMAQAPAAPKATGRSELVDYLNKLTRDRLAARAKEVAAIPDKAGALKRRDWARKTVLDLIGGLPPRVPLHTRSYGTVKGDGFTVERVMFDSQPGYHVTANIYLPKGKGPFAAVIVSPGHGANGKIANRTSAGLLARAGIIAMTYDISGMGERLQYYDPDLEVSRVGAPTSEHSMEFWQVQPVGGHVSRYFIRDAMAGLDYLSSRRDVDKNRLGALGCSGGGTVTAYLGALEPRLKAIGTACYITTFDKLYDKQGPQDAEQSIPGFIAKGLDLADWVEMAAPTPYAIISTTEDMFPFAGAKTSYEEAKRFYGLVDAPDNLHWITGPGPHGNLGPIYPDIVAFYTRYLNNDAAKRPADPVTLPTDEQLIMTPTGQISTSIGGATLQSLNAARAAKVAAPHPTIRTAAQLSTLQARLKPQVRAMIRATVQPGGSPPAVRVVASQDSDGAHIQTLKLHMANGLETDGVLATPAGGGRHPAVLLMTKDEPGKGTIAQVLALAKAGKTTLALTATGGGGTDQLKGSLLGDWNLLALRMLLIDKVPLGMRVDDAIQAVDWLRARDDVDAQSITAYGLGLMGPAALHLAVLDDRITGVVVDGSLLNYRMAVDSHLQKLLPEVLPQGVLRQYDLDDLALAVAPRAVTYVNPQDAVGVTLEPHKFKAAMAYVQTADQALGEAGRIRFKTRGARDPLVVP